MSEYRRISTRDLFGEFSRRLAEVVSLQARLMRAEIGEAAGKAGMGAALLGAGAIVLLAAVFVLMLAAVALLERLGLAPDLSYLTVALVGLILAAGLLFFGTRQFNADVLGLPRSRRQLVKLGHIAGSE